MERIIPKTLTIDEFNKLMAGVKKPKKKLAYMLGFFACMRVSEVIKLQPENVSKERRLIQIVQAKGNKDRNIPLPPEVIGGLKHLPIGTTMRALQKSFKLDCIKHLGAEYSWTHFHTLRHSGATYYLNVKHWDIRQLQTMLGHSRITVTEIYTHVSPEDLIKKMWEE